MPLYSFVCPVCGTHFDERLSLNQETHTATCPRGHQGARRIFSPPTVVFKGSGFYVTDHRKNTPKESSGD